MSKLFLWGTGGFAEKFLPFIEEMICDYDITIEGFCDNDRQQQGKEFHGYKVYPPDALSKAEYDMVIIFVYPEIVPPIMQQLIEVIGLEREKIGFIEDILELTQRQHRNSLPKKQTRKPQIFDCFTFFNELDILKIRFKLLAPYVDHFVIVEMSKTHKGEEKKLIFKEHADEFKEYMDKVIHIIPENIPEYTGKNTKLYMNFYDGDDWTLLDFQRSCIERGLEIAEPEDLICISDCDEIINPKYLRQYKDKKYSSSMPIWMRILDKTAISLNQSYHYYYFNCILNHQQNTSVLVKNKNLTNVQHIRHLINFLPSLENGGWHLTYFGNAEMLQQKARASVEGKDVTKADIEYRMQHGIDLYGREGNDYGMHFINRREIDIPYIDELIEKYPQYYLEDKS